jgi:hypothetical protein
MVARVYSIDSPVNVSAQASMVDSAVPGVASSAHPSCELRPVAIGQSSCAGWSGKSISCAFVKPSTSWPWAARYASHSSRCADLAGAAE